MQYGRRSGILFSSFVIYERERFCFFAAQGAARDRRRSAAFFCGRVGGVRCLRDYWRGGEISARCSIVALRPVGRIARFAPHLQVAVSATGRAPFRCLLVFTQSHAAELARPRYARTLRDSFMRPRAAWAWATLGALPLKPHQGTEFPGPSTFLPPACVRSYEPFHAAIDAESASPASKYNSAKSPAYPRPPSASGIPLRPARSAGT